MCHHYHLDWEYATKKMSFQSLMLLAASSGDGSKADKKEEGEGPVDFTEFIIGKMSQN